jgi:hypothetical protein
MLSSVTRSQVLSFRVRAQQLDLGAVALADASVLDIGAQDSGPDGAKWALANRGPDVSEMSDVQLVRVWTIRGAPHLYQREDLPSVAAAVEPFSDADAGKRIYDASKPLKAAGISNLAALDAVAAAMQSVVTGPSGQCRALGQELGCGPCRDHRTGRATGGIPAGALVRHRPRWLTATAVETAPETGAEGWST